MQFSDAFLNFHFNLIENRNYQLIEHSKHHLIFNYSNWTFENYLEEKLSQRIKKIYPETTFVSQLTAKMGKKVYEKVRYSLYYERDGDQRITIEVVEQNGKLLFNPKESDYPKELQDLFIEEIKNLPKYRLLAVTQ